MTTVIKQPKVTFNILPTARTAQNTEQKILFLGQQTTGNAVAGALNENIANGGAEDTLHGENSQISGMIRANKIRNQQVQVDSIGLADNGGGVKAAGALVIGGAATEAGTLLVIAGSERNHAYTIAVADLATATQIGDLIVTAITADTKAPVENPVNTTGSVAVTAVNAGTLGNSIPLEIRGSVAGLTTSVTGMSGGATDPVLTGVFDVIGANRYQAIVWPYVDDLTEVKTLLDGRFNSDGSVLDGVAFTAKTDTKANLETLADANNSQSLVILGDKLETESSYTGASIVEMPMIKASAFAGYRGLRLDVDGFSIADLVIATNGALDGFGGPALASKPYFNTPFAELVPMQPQRGFNDSEIEDLTDSGITVLGNNTAGNGVIAGEVVTTYKTDIAGNPDDTFKFLNYVDTSSQIREYYATNFQKRFGQSRLSEGSLVKGRDVVNELLAKSFAKRLYQDLSSPDFVLVEAGEDALNFFEANLSVSIDKGLGKLTFNSLVVPIVTQLREIQGPIQIAFSINV